MKINWIAWRWYTSHGNPGSWSLNHALDSTNTALCGVQLPNIGRIFDTHGGSGQPRCKRCQNLINKRKLCDE